MYSKNVITNSQFIRLRLVPASVAQRIFARIIDCIIVSFASSTLMGVTAILSSITNDYVTYSVIFLNLLPFLYPLIAEVFWNGQTLGKSFMKIRVIMADGNALTTSAAIVRFLLFFVDAYFFLIGLIFMFTNKSHQRIGDMAGGCIDISEEDFAKYNTVVKEMSFTEGDYTPTFEFAKDMTWGQISFINNTLHKFDSNYISNINILAHTIKKKYNVENTTMWPNAFLKTIIRDYNYYNREIGI
jgi:uncharacterized RDD family membrane protein YckC